MMKACRVKASAKSIAGQVDAPARPIRIGPALSITCTAHGVVCRPVGRTVTIISDRYHLVSFNKKNQNLVMIIYYNKSHSLRVVLWKLYGVFQ